MATSPSKESQRQFVTFCSPPASAVPSPLFRKGGVYCLSSFTARAEQWYKQEADRQTGAKSFEGLSQGSSRRRQPPRAAKGKSHAEGRYSLSKDEVEVLHLSHCDRDVSTSILPGEGGDSRSSGLRWNVARLQERAEADNTDFHERLLSFRSRLSAVVHAKIQELKAHYEPSGIQHICTVADSTWNCLDEEFCGHGLVERCIQWIPKRLGDFKPRVRAEMDEFFARWVFPLEAASDRSDKLKRLKRNRYSKLKEFTLAKVLGIEKEWIERPRPMVDALMLETPTLGRWPARGFVREDVSAQTVKFAGLVFAVDVCQGEPRLIML